MAKFLSFKGPRAEKCFAWFDGVVGGWQMRPQNKGRRRKRAERMERAERIVRHQRLEDIGAGYRCEWHKHCRHDPAKWDGSDE